MKKHEPQPRSNRSINHAMRVILDAINDDPTMVLMADEKAGVYLIPAVMSPDSTEDKSKVGCVQYSVSDGLPGERSSSVDFWNLPDAIKFFKLVKDKGWLLASTRGVANACQRTHHRVRTDFSRMGNRANGNVLSLLLLLRYVSRTQ